MTLPSKPQSSRWDAATQSPRPLGASAKVGKTRFSATGVANHADRGYAPRNRAAGRSALRLACLGLAQLRWCRQRPCADTASIPTVGLDLVGDIWKFADLYFGTTKDGMKLPASAVSDYGRSSAKARSAFEAELGRLLAAPVGIWFVAHLREKTDKEGQLTVYAPDMDKAVHGYIMGAVDFVWLAETQPNGRRVVHTQPTPHFEAGSRVSLPSPLPMDAAEIARAMDRALNPHAYDEQGNRKVVEPEPAPVLLRRRCRLSRLSRLRRT